MSICPYIFTEGLGKCLCAVNPIITVHNMQESLLNQFNNAELLELDPLCGTLLFDSAKNYKLMAEQIVHITIKYER